MPAEEDRRISPSTACVHRPRPRITVSKSGMRSTAAKFMIEQASTTTTCRVTARIPPSRHRLPCVGIASAHLQQRGRVNLQESRDRSRADQAIHERVHRALGHGHRRPGTTLVTCQVAVLFRPVSPQGGLLDGHCAQPGPLGGINELECFQAPRQRVRRNAVVADQMSEYLRRSRASGMLANVCLGHQHGGGK